MDEEYRLVMRGADGRLRELTDDEKMNVVYDTTIPKMTFRELSPEEEASFREWARTNFKVNETPDPRWHPVVRDEWTKLQAQSDPLMK
jgi:hypothetical protein